MRHSNYRRRTCNHRAWRSQNWGLISIIISSTTLATTCLASASSVLGIGDLMSFVISWRAAKRQYAVWYDCGQDRLELLGRRYPAVQAGRDAGDLIKDPKIDAIVIATPTASHFELAMQALGAGKHVLVEKPMTATVAEADRTRDRGRTSWAHSDG